MFRIIHLNRWFFWTITILLAVGLVLFILILEAISDFEEQASKTVFMEGENWKLFRSEELGLRLRYPSSWQIEIDPLEPLTFSLENPKNFNENITVSVVQPQLEKVIRQSLNIASEEKVIVDGRSGVWIKSQDKKDRATSNVILVKNAGRLYYIAGQAQVFKRIIRDIKFLPR